MSEPTGADIFDELRNHMENLGWERHWPDIALRLATPPSSPVQVAQAKEKVVEKAVAFVEAGSGGLYGERIDALVNSVAALQDVQDALEGKG